MNHVEVENALNASVEDLFAPRPPLETEAGFARMYARDDSPLRAGESLTDRVLANGRAGERAAALVYAYAEVHGVPERETTIRLARDAVEELSQ